MSAQSSIARADANRSRILALARVYADQHGGNPPPLKELVRQTGLWEKTVAKHMRALMEAGEWPEPARVKMKPAASFYRKVWAVQRLMRATYPDRYEKGEGSG